MLLQFLTVKQTQCPNFPGFFANILCTLNWMRNPFWILAGSEKSWFKIKENWFLTAGHLSLCKA